MHPMPFRLYVFFCILFLQNGFAQTIDLQGTWTCTRSTTLYYSQTHHLLAPDSDEYSRVYHFNLYIQNDSLWQYEYPCFYRGSGTFLIRNDSLYFNGQKKAYGKINIQNGRVEIRSLDPEWKTPVWETWERDTIGLRELVQLKKDSVNYGCLLGNYRLVTHYSPPDGDAYVEHFPFKLPLYVQLKHIDSVKQMSVSNKIYLDTPWGKRLFKVFELRWNNNHAREMPSPGFILFPGDWWKGEEFSVQYVLVHEKIPASELLKKYDR